jgi:hypothetical protein
MPRILAVAAILAIFTILCPTPSPASDVSTPSMARLAALTIGSKTERRMTPRPGLIRSACASENVRCGNPGDEECCRPMFCDCPSGSACICRHRR